MFVKLLIVIFLKTCMALYCFYMIINISIIIIIIIIIMSISGVISMEDLLLFLQYTTAGEINHENIAPEWLGCMYEIIYVMSRSIR